MRLTGLLNSVQRQRALEATDIERFARRYGVSVRTIYRDLETIKALGFTVPPFAYRGVKA